MGCERCRVDLNITSRGSIEEYWCLCKHLLHAEGHTEESIANASKEGDLVRVNQLGVLLNIIRTLRQKIVEMALNDENGRIQIKY